MGHTVSAASSGQARVLRVLIGVGLLAGAVSAGGCDKIKQWMGGASVEDTSGTSTAESMGEVPPRPFVSPIDVVASVGGKTISRRDLALAIQELKATVQSLGQTWTPLSPEAQPDRYDLTDLLDELILAELRAQDAVAYGLGRNDLEVQTKFWNRYRTFFAQEWVNWQLNQVTVTDEEVAQFHRDNQAGFREPEQIRIRQMILPSEQQAKTALVKLLEGVSFESVAQQMPSLRPEAATGALVDQWVLRAAEKAAFAPQDNAVRALLDKSLEDAAFAIDRVGGVSGNVKAADGNYHIFQLVERTPGRQRPLVEVADNIRNFLRLQRVVQDSDALRSKATVDRFPERLKDVPQ